MKKHLIVIGTAVLLLVVGLCGCNEINPFSDDVELVNTWIDKIPGYYSYDSYEGTIKNIAGKHLEKITITVNFYDINNNFLFSETTYIYNLANTYTKDFSVMVFPSNSYYEHIHHVEYEFKV